MELGYEVQSGQPAQHVALAVQPLDGVGAAVVEPGHRTGLAQHHHLAGAAVARLVHAAAVGEVQRPLDVVGEVLGRGAGPGLDLLTQEVGDGDPLGDREDRSAQVRDEVAGRVAQRGDRAALLVQTVQLAVGAVADEEQAVTPAQVAEDVRAAPVGQQRFQAGEHPVQLGLVPRVEGQQLPAGTPRRVFRIRLQDGFPTAQEFDTQVLFMTELEDDVDDLRRLVEGTGDVHLPALVGQRLAVGVQVDPDAVPAAAPALGHRCDGRCVEALDVVLGAGVVVEDGIRLAELLVVRRPHREIPPHTRRAARGGARPSPPAGPVVWPGVRSDL